MKIKREIFGQQIEIELTEREVYDAYAEQEHLYDLEDCRNDFELRYSDEDWFSDVFDNEEAMEVITEQMAAIYRRNMDKYTMSHDYALDDAATDEEVMKLIEKYKDNKCVDASEFIIELEKIADMHDFELHPYEENDVLCGYELEGYTPRGVNMLHFIDCRDDGVNPVTVWEELQKIYLTFDTDDQIDIHRQDPVYVRNFRIKESIKDFEDYDSALGKFVSEASEMLSKMFEEEETE